METITIPKKELKTMIKESVREILEQEPARFRALLMPFVSKEEQKDIEDRYGSDPSQKEVAESVKIKI